MNGLWGWSSPGRALHVNVLFVLNNSNLVFPISSLPNVSHELIIALQYPLADIVMHSAFCSKFVRVIVSSMLLLLPSVP